MHLLRLNLLKTGEVMDILTTIQNIYPQLSSKEKHIAGYVLNKANQIQNMNISVLAAAVGVSAGTITRFCKRINCDSFAEFKIKLSSAGKPSKSSDSDLLNQVYDFYSTVVQRSNSLIDKNMLTDIVNAIQQAKRIYIYGVGSSGLTASEFMLRLLRMGFNVQSISDPHLMLINSSILSKDDLIIAISISGETAELVNAVKIAKQNGSKIIAMTCFGESSLACVSDTCVIVAGTMFVNKELFVNAQFSVVYIIDLLTTLFLEDDIYKDKMQITVETITKQSNLKSK